MPQAGLQPHRHVALVALRLSHHDRRHPCSVLAAPTPRDLTFVGCARQRYGQGRSERLLGHALEGVPRKAFYINSKIGR